MDTSAYAMDTPSAFDVDPTPHPRRDAPSDHQMAFQSLETGYDDSPPARFEMPPSSERPPARRQPREREPPSRRAPPSSRRSSNVGGRSPPRRGPGPRVSRMTSDSGFSHATSKSDLDEQRLKREEEIRQIAIKRAERVKKQEEARAREETEKRKMEEKIRAKRKVLAKQANDKGRGGNFKSIMSSSRAAPAAVATTSGAHAGSGRGVPGHRRRVRDVRRGRVGGGPRRSAGERAEAQARAAHAEEGWRSRRGGFPPAAGGEVSAEAEKPRSPVGAKPRDGGEPSPAKSRPPPVVRTTENSFLKQKKEKEAAARAKENEERRKEQERKAKAQARAPPTSRRRWSSTRS